MHLNIVDDALNLDVRVFCLDMVGAAMDWQQTCVGTQPYESNITKFMTRYPNGLAPYIVGIPVIT